MLRQESTDGELLQLDFKWGICTYEVLVLLKVVRTRYPRFRFIPILNSCKKKVKPQFFHCKIRKKN